MGSTVQSIPYVGRATILSTQTDAVGTNWTAIGGASGASAWGVDIVNNTGTALEYRRNGIGASMVIPDGTSRLVLGISNTNQISVRRVDVSNTQVTFGAEAYN